MILIDGVKYRLWVPEKEVEEFHPIIKEHHKDIFGDNTIFIEGSKLKAQTGIGAIPDGFVIEINRRPKWHIVEIELSAHEIYRHIVNQVGRFIIGIKNTETQQQLVENIYNYLQDNKVLKAEFEEITRTNEIHRYISDLIKKPPILVIVIEERTKELEEALNLLKYSPINVIVFQTYIREGARSVHAHLFGPTNPVQEKTALEKDFLLKLEQDIKTLKPDMQVDMLNENRWLRLKSHDIKVHFEFWLYEDGQLGIELHFETDNPTQNRRWMKRVMEYQNDSGNQLGESLKYQFPFDKRYARIYAIPSVSTTGQAIYEMNKFQKVFVPILRELNIYR